MDENMAYKYIPFSPPDIRQEDIDAVCDVLRSTWITTGPKVKEFESKLAAYCKVKNMVCLNSATAALELNLRVLGIGEGDQVIVPAYTYTATASPIVHLGAEIVFVDCAKNSFQMDYDAVEKAVTDKTKAIIAVDLFGVVCDYNRLFEIAEKKKNIFKPSNDIQKAMGRLAVVADCAHALGAKRDGLRAGAIADFSSFSFHAVKNLTTAEGGAATWKSIKGISDSAIYKQYQLFSLHGQSKDALSKSSANSWEYDVIGAWYKCNMTDITAAIGIKQLERYESLLKIRKDIIARYNAACDKLGVEYVLHSTDSMESSGHLYITHIPGVSVEKRNEIIENMAKKGVACNVHYKPLPMMTAYKNMGFDIKDYPNAYKFYENEITLPLYTSLTDEDVEYIIQCFTECLA